MATLPEADRVEIWAQAMLDLSRTNTGIPIEADEFRTLVNFFDNQLEDAEATIFAALPAGDGKTWMLANLGLGRELLARIERRRREVL